MLRQKVLNWTFINRTGLVGKTAIVAYQPMQYCYPCGIFLDFISDDAPGKSFILLHLSTLIYEVKL